MKQDGTYARIYSVVRHIPPGRVATYGQIAKLAGLQGHARQVGYALHALPEDSVLPWHRVINAKGEISVRSTPGCAQLQRSLLESEGVVFDRTDSIPLSRYQWSVGRRTVRKLAG